jgi:hypothetical protein
MPDSDPAFVALARDAGGRVTGLRLDELAHMHKRPDSA